MNEDFYTDIHKEDNILAANRQIEAMEKQTGELKKALDKHETNAAEVARANTDQLSKVTSKLEDLLGDFVLAANTLAKKKEVIEVKSPDVHVEQKTDVGAIIKGLKELKTEIGKIDVRPEVKVSPEVKVKTEKIQLPPIEKVEIPTGRGKKPNKDKANPTRFVSVRLTDGEKFYEPTAGAAASTERFPFADDEAKPKLVRVDKNGSIYTVLPGLELGAERIPGQDSLLVQARNPSVDSGAQETIWDQGGLYTFLASAETIYLSSTDINDTTQLVLTIGLDADFNEQEALTVLSGQSQVEVGTGLTWRAVNRLVAITTPSGNVYAAESDSLTGGIPDTQAKIKAKMITPNNNTFSGAYVVPASKTLFIDSVIYSIGKGKDATIGFRIEAPGFPAITGNFVELFEGNITQEFKFFQSIPEKSCIEIFADATNDGTAMSVGILGVLEDN